MRLFPESEGTLFSPSGGKSGSGGGGIGSGGFFFDSLGLNGTIFFRSLGFVLQFLAGIRNILEGCSSLSWILSIASSRSRSNVSSKICSYSVPSGSSTGICSIIETLLNRCTSRLSASFRFSLLPLNFDVRHVLLCLIFSNSY